MISLRRCLICCLFSLSNGLFANTTLPSQPMPIARSQQNAAPNIIPAPPLISSQHYVLLDAQSGAIIAQKNINQRRPPASLTKLMTLYLIFNALDNGQITENARVPISRKAWATGGSKMFVKVGTTVPVKDLIQGIIITSGNDACVAMAQYLAGNEKTFATYMNAAAKQLGMTHSHFVDSTGLPHPGHYSTPGDLAILARAIITHFPQYYHWFDEKWFTYNGIKQPNRNRLLWRDPSVDGLKTGHTQAAGYCLIASGKRKNTRLISVVMGTPSDAARANDSQAVLNYGFRFYRNQTVATANTPLTEPRVWLGNQTHVPCGLAHDLSITIPNSNHTQITQSIKPLNRLTAPIDIGDACGELIVKNQQKIIAQAPLITLKGIPAGGWTSRVRDRVLMIFHRKA